MSAAILRLLTVASLLLMSLGMGSAVAAQAPAAANAAGECTDHPHKQAPVGAPDHGSPLCAAACAALPAAPATEAAAPLSVAPALAMTATPGLHGIILEIATPPPRLA